MSSASLTHWKVNGEHEAWFLSALKGQGGGVGSRLTGQRQLQAPLSITGLTPVEILTISFIINFVQNSANIFAFLFSFYTILAYFRQKAFRQKRPCLVSGAGLGMVGAKANIVTLQQQDTSTRWPVPVAALSTSNIDLMVCITSK